MILPFKTRRQKTLSNTEIWKHKQKLCMLTGARYYGDGGTTYNSSKLDIQVNKEGKVVAIWFRCQALPFTQSEVDEVDSDSYDQTLLPKLRGVEVEDA